MLGQPFCPKVTLISPFRPEETWLSIVQVVELIEKSRQMQKKILFSRYTFREETNFNAPPDNRSIGVEVYLRLPRLFGRDVR